MSQNSMELHKPFIKVRSEPGSEDVVHYHIFYEGQLPEEFKSILMQELKETKENKKEGLERLKEFIKKENLPYIGDHQLMAVLRNCKYNIKKSEAKLKKYIYRRREVKNMLTEMGLEKIENVIDDMGFGILPYRDKHGRCIMYTRPWGMNLERYEAYYVGTMVAASGLLLLNYPLTQVSGFVHFGECKAPSLYVFYPIFKTVKRFIPHLIYFPIRIARIELLNINDMVRWFCKIVSPILTKKTVDRLSFHSEGYDDLHRIYSPDILPEDFGGNLGPLNTAAYKDKLLVFIKDLMNENI